MVLLGITGTKGSGKGTVAQFVAEWATENGLLAVDRGFADKLKWAMARIFWPKITLDEALKWANEFKNESYAFVDLVREDLVPGASMMSDTTEARITGRQFFQHGGTEMGREIFGDNFWVDQLLPLGVIRYTAWEDNFWPNGRGKGDRASIATISDLRFENEVERIKQLGGSIWCVQRSGHEPDEHASETPLDKSFIDVTIENDGGLERLRGFVFGACDQFIKGGTG